MNLAYIHYLAGDAPALSHVNQFREAARGLGHRVDLLAPESASRELPGPADAPSPARRLAARYGREPRLLARNLGRRRREEEALREMNCDLVLARHDLLTCSAAVAARHLDLPLVLEVNAPVAESRLYFDEYWHMPIVAERMEAWLLRQADGVTVVSSALKRHLDERTAGRGVEPVVVPNGVDTDLFHPRVPLDAEVVERLQHRPVVGFVGSFQRFHGADLLAQTMEQLAEKRPDIGFLLVGDGPDAEAARQCATQLGDRALFLGNVPHARVPGLVRCIDIALLPATASYCSPLKIMEWMASGCAVVAPATDPMHEVIEHGVEGLLFTPGDRRGLIAAIERLADEPGLRTKLGEAATRRARLELTWTDNARRILEVCETARERWRARKRR